MDCLRACNMPGGDVRDHAGELFFNRFIELSNLIHGNDLEQMQCSISSRMYSILYFKALSCYQPFFKMN